MPTKKTKKTTTRSEPFDIYVVGLGIMAVFQTTREAEEAIRSCNHALYVDHSLGVAEYLKGLCGKATSLLNLYQEHESRLETYRSMAATVIEAALTEPPVCFAAYGHPTMYVYPTVLIRKAASLLNLKVHVVPGISIFDTAIVDLGFDPGITGFQMYEATAVLVEERALQPDVPCLLLQVDTVESALFTRAQSTPERFRRLQKHLLKFYPPSHVVTALYSSTFPILPPIRDSFPLSELPERAVRGAQSGTLYIPPIQRTGKRDTRLEKQLYDPKHLAKITASSQRSRTKA